MEIKSAIIVTKKDLKIITSEDILHICAYEHIPESKEDYQKLKDYLYKELENDPELDLGVPLDECQFIIANDEILEAVKDIAGDIEE